ncbi:MAG: DUF5777 family beta-barrel protein [Prolixibacteraceae bacterium]
MRYILIIFFSFICLPGLMAQEDLSQLFGEPDSVKKGLPVMATFKSPRLINGQSTETIHKHDLLFVVTHRFGDLAGSEGGTKTFFGLDNSTDIQIALDYGLSDNWNVGIGRAKGAPNGVSTHQSQLYYLNTKYRLIRQTEDNRTPVSLTLFGNSVVSGMKKVDIETSDAAFGKFSDRLSYVAQAIIARKFSENLSLAMLPTYVRRNYVSYMDMNNLFSLGFGGRMKVSRRMAVVADYFLSFRKDDSKDYFSEQKDLRFYNPLGLGLEIETGGHVFNLSFTNATAILENQFVPSTTSSWADGEFRWGFSITRRFTTGKKTSP